VTDLNKIRLYCPTPSKRRYLTEATAFGQAKLRTAQTGIEMMAYRCQCDLFHICQTEKQRNTTARHEQKLALARAAAPKPWQTWEDDLILSGLTIAELVPALGRSAKAIYGRRKLLRQKETG
jgi:hypothetical protein